MTTAGGIRGLHGKLSLRMRTTLWMLLVSAVIQGMLATMLLMYERSTLDAYLNTRLSVRMRSAVAAASEPGFVASDASVRKLVEEGTQFLVMERLWASMFNKDGELVASSVPHLARADDPAILNHLKAGGSFIGRATHPGLVTSDNPDGWGRVALQHVRAADGSHYALLLAMTDARYRTIMNLSMIAVWIAVPIGAFATAVAGWFIGGLALAPLRQLARVAHSLAPERLDEEIVQPPAPAELAALELDLQDTRAKLRQALQAQDRFISNVAHELKTPIAVLMIEAETLPKNNLPAAERVIKSAAEEMARLGRMVESFLTLTKLRGGHGLSRAEPCDVHEMVVAAAEACASMAKQQGILLAPEFTDRFPPIKVSGACPLLTTMVENLMRNAIKHSPSGKPVVVRVWDADGQCFVSVRDFGTGIAPELIAELFDRFAQGSRSAGGRGSGSSLGLSVAQGVAELHGGGITVQNLSQGCEFTVRLPLLEETA